MKKTKMLVSVAAATIALLATYTTAFATIDAYTVKDAKTGVVRLYDFDGLIGSVINSKLGLGNDLLFKDFAADQTANGVNSIYDDSKKYVPFDDAKKALEDSKIAGQAFDLNQYLKDAKAGETPTYVYERKVKDNKVVNGLDITKEGAQIDLSKENFQDYEDVKVLAGNVTLTNGTVKGKLIVDAGKGSEVTVKNVTGDSITGLSGNLKLEGVVANQLVIEKALTLNVDTASTLNKLVINAPAGSEVVLSGNLGTVELSSAVKLTIAEGAKVNIVVTNDAAKDTELTANNGAQVSINVELPNTAGPGTITVNPGTTNPGTGGGTYTPDHTALYTAINGIFTAVDNLDNKFNSNAGYLTITASGNSATVTLPAGKTAGTLINELKASTTVAAVSSLSEYNALVTAVKTTAGVNTGDIIDAIEAELNGLGMGQLYNPGLPFIQNLVNLANNAGKTQIVNNSNNIVITNGIRIKGYKVTSIKENSTNTTVYTYNSTNNTGEITKANLKAALGGKTYEQAAVMTVKELLQNRSITITLQDASGYSTTYTVSFN